MNLLIRIENMDVRKFSCEVRNEICWWKEDIVKIRIKLRHEVIVMV